MAIKFADIEAEIRLDNTGFKREALEALQVMSKTLQQMNAQQALIFNKMGTTVTRHAKKHEQAAAKIGETWWKRFGAVAFGFTLAYRAINLVEHGVAKMADTFKDAIVESGELASLQAKLAFWAVMNSKGVITYGEAFEKAAVNVRALQEASLMSISSLSELATGIDEVAQTIGAVPPGMMKQAAALVDFTIMVAQTTGSTVRQVREELQSLMQGTIRSSSILIRTMKNLGVITDEDLEKLRKMTDQVSVFEKVANKVYEHWSEVMVKLLTTNVTVAAQFWEKNIRFMITESIRMASEIDKVGNIFAAVFYKHATEFLGGLEQADWERNIVFIRLLAVGLDKLLSMFESTLLGIGKFIAIIYNLKNAFTDLDPKIKTAIKGFFAFSLLSPMVTIVYKFGAAILALALGPITSLIKVLNTLHGRIILIPILLTAAALAARAFSKSISETVFSRIGKASDDAKKKAQEAEDLWEAFRAGSLTIKPEDLKLPATEYAKEFYKSFMDQPGTSEMGKDFSSIFLDSFKTEGLFLAEELSAPIKKIFKAVMDKVGGDWLDVSKLVDWEKLDENSKKYLEGLGFNVKKPVEETAEAVKKYASEIEKLRMEYMVLSAVQEQIDMGIIDPEDIKDAQKNLEIWTELAKIPKSLQSEWIKYTYAIQEFEKSQKAAGDAAKKMADESKKYLEDAFKTLEDRAKDRLDVEKDVSAELAEMRMSDFQNEMFMLNRLYDERMAKTHDDKKLIDQTNDWHRLSIEKLKNDYSTFYKGMRDLTEQTAQAMSQGFSDFFFDIFTNQLKTLGDYLEAFLNSILRATADVLAYMIKAITFGTVQSSGALGGGWLSSAINSLTKAGTTTTTTPGAAVPVDSYQHGGWIPEPVLGVGKSGRMYSFAEAGPEYVNPTGSGGGDGIDRVIVNNYGPIPAKTSEKKNMMGGRDIIVQISEAMAADVKNEGPLHYQMRRTFGVKPVLGGR